MNQNINSATNGISHTLDHIFSINEEGYSQFVKDCLPVATIHPSNSTELIIKEFIKYQEELDYEK